MKTFAFLHRTCTNTILYRMDPLRGLGTHPSVLVHASGRLSVLGTLEVVFWLKRSVAWEEARRILV